MLKRIKTYNDAAAIIVTRRKMKIIFRLQVLSVALGLICMSVALVAHEAYSTYLLAQVSMVLGYLVIIILVFLGIWNNEVKKGLK